MANNKKSLEDWQILMKQKHDWEDRMDNIANEKWRLNNENTKCGQQLRLVEDQLRMFFDRKRVELKKDNGVKR